MVPVTVACVSSFSSPYAATPLPARFAIRSFSLASAAIAYVARPVFSSWAFSVRYSGISAIFIAPGVEGFVPQTPGSRLFSDAGRVVCPALVAGGSGGDGESQPLAAVAIDDEAFWAPPVDPAELHLLDIVVSLCPLNYVHYQAIPFLSKHQWQPYRDRHWLSLSPSGIYASRRIRSPLITRKR